LVANVTSGAAGAVADLIWRDARSVAADVRPQAFVSARAAVVLIGEQRSRGEADRAAGDLTGLTGAPSPAGAIGGSAEIAFAVGVFEANLTDRAARGDGARTVKHTADETGRGGGGGLQQ
jgi:hypothetical protein